MSALTGWLCSLLIGHRCIVSVALERGLDYTIVILASWKIGAVYLALAQSLPVKRMHYMIADSGASCLITLNEIIKEKSLALESSKIICLNETEVITRS